MPRTQSLVRPHLTDNEGPWFQTDAKRQVSLRDL